MPFAAVEPESALFCQHPGRSAVQGARTCDASRFALAACAPGYGWFVHVIVMGCGRVGSALARELVNTGHTVTVVDKDAAAFSWLGRDFQGETVEGNGFDLHVLQRAGAERASGFAAVSSGDNSNIISARIARETFGIDRVIARIYDPRRAEVYERMGIPTIATTPWTLRRFYRFITGAAEGEPWADPTGSVVLAVRRIPERLVGHAVGDIERALPGKIVALTRFGECTIPAATMLLQAGDTVHIAVTADLSDTFGSDLLDREEVAGG